MSLIEHLKQIEDYRAPRGRRYPLWLMILLAILGTMSECYGYAALEDFCVRHYGAVCECFGIAVPRLPSDSTFRRLFEQLDFERVVSAFNAWAGVQMPITEGDWLAIDGKSIKGTLSHYRASYQNFVNVVSVYSHQHGVVVALKQFENKATSELTVVQTLLETLQVSGVVFTLDALHTQKKRLN